MEQVGGPVVLVQDGPSDGELVQTLLACNVAVHLATPAEVFAKIDECSPAAVVLELGDMESTLLTDLSARLPAAIRLIAIGNLRSIAQSPGATPPDCVLFSDADEATLRVVLAGAPPVRTDMLLDELLTLSVLGVDLSANLHELTIRVARAFEADNCVLLLSEEAMYYAAREISEEAIADLVPLCQTVCQLSTTLIAPPRPDRPYRAFLGVPLAHDNAPPMAQLLLCRESPMPFHRDARRYLGSLASRLATDLSWRLVHERMLADRDKLRDLSRIDPVLGVANRTALQEELSKRVAASEQQGEPFSVAILDVDGLRLINERSGYPAGDAVLNHIAQVAQNKLRPQDMVARYAGDAVAIVLPGVSSAEATTMLTQILSAIDAEPVMHEDKAINLTVSAGIAELHYDADTGETALARAMAARKSARLHGDVIAIADPSQVVDSPAQPDFAIGTTLGGVYQIRHEIARGAFGVVYRAEDLALGRQVALKLLRPDLARDTGFVERFRSEAATLARIRNPNLVQVYAFGVDGSNVFFAMELVEGQGLDERIESAQARRRHLPLPEVIGIIDQVAQALEAVHQAGVLHRDVKPENVLIDRIHRRCVLVDVGISVRRGSEKNPAGTPGFTAPEVFGDGGESPATDVYSLGALAYLLLTLQTPFGGDASPLEILSQQASQRPIALTQIRRDLPPGVDGVLLPALDPDPHKRPQSARALAKALSDVLSKSIGSDKRQKPRMTLEPPDGVRITVRNASLRSAPVAAPSSRGILFRSAYEVLGARRGTAWIAEVSRKVPEAAQALGAQSSALGWHPTTAFIFVLQSLGNDEHESRTLAFHLGRTAVASSFSQFYGADPSAVTPAQVLRVADMFWRSYHTWGAVSVAARDTDAEVTITKGIQSAILCSSTAGLLAGVVAHAGGQAVTVEHTACIAKDARHCVFHVAWRAST